MGKKRKILKNVTYTGPLFSGVSKKEINLIDRRTETVNAAAGKVLVTEGATGAEFFIIGSGSAEVSRRGQHVATLVPGDFFGDLSLLTRAPCNATVITTEPSELIVLGQREFAGLVDEVPGFANKLLAVLARRLAEYDAAETKVNS